MRHLVGLACLIALVLPASADARRIALPIYDLNLIDDIDEPVIEEHVRVSVPNTGRVTRTDWGRAWRHGRCWVTLRAEVMSGRDRSLEASRRVTVARFTLPDRKEYLRTVYLVVDAHRCARDRTTPIVRSARLDARRRPCDAFGTTLAANDRFRFYADGGAVIACERAPRRRTYYGTTRDASTCFPDLCWIDRLVLAGRFVAWAAETVARMGADSRIVVRDTLTGRVVRERPAGRPCTADGQYNSGPVAALVLRDDGAAAWVVTDCDTGILEVRTFAGQVSAGHGVDPASLRVAGDTVTWVQGGQTRTAPL